MAEEKWGGGKDDIDKRGWGQLIYKELEPDELHLFHLWHWIQERRHWRKLSDIWRRIIFNPETENPIPNWVQQQSKYIFRRRGLRSFISHALFLGNLLEGVLPKNEINQERRRYVLSKTLNLAQEDSKGQFQEWSQSWSSKGQLVQTRTGGLKFLGRCFQEKQREIYKMLDVMKHWKTKKHEEFYKGK